MSGESKDTLLRRVASSMFWNATLLPVIAILNLVASVLIRRTFGLGSGVYDTLIGIANTVLGYSSLGIPESLPKLLPDLAVAGPGAATALVRRAWLLRLALLAMPLLLLNSMTVRVATAFQLGEHGTFLLQAVTVLALGRAVMDLVNRTLQGGLAHRTANLLLGIQATAVLALLFILLSSGGGIGTILFGMGVIALLTAGCGGHAVIHLVAAYERRLHGPQPTRRPDEFSPGLPRTRFFRFVIFLYLISISSYFARPGFASLGLNLVSDGVGAVALFNTGYQIPQTMAVLLLSSFQGLYVPMFARLLATPDKLRTAYQEVSKVQAVLLLPAAAGLLVMLGDYIPLIYGHAFGPAVPIARTLTVALFVEAFLSLGGILLTTAEVIRPVLLAQLLIVLGAGPFVLAARTGNLVLTAAIFPAGRLLAALTKHLIARRRFGVRFPWAFVARASLPSLAMVAILIPARPAGGTSWLGALLLTMLGAVIVLIGMRVFRVLGPRELDVLQRAQIPGSARILTLLASRGNSPASHRDR